MTHPFTAFSWSWACLNHPKSGSINTFDQRRQIHFYVASLLPGKTICSNCSVCLHSRLCELLLETRRHHEDLTSRLKQSRETAEETKSSPVKSTFLRLWSHKQDSFTHLSRTQAIIQLHFRKLDITFVLLSWRHSQTVAPSWLLMAHDNFLRCSLYCWMAPNSKNDTV